MNVEVVLGLVVAVLGVWVLVVVFLPDREPKPPRRVASALKDDPWRVTQLRRGKADS
jgi:hypothetical protein